MPTMSNLDPNMNNSAKELGKGVIVGNVLLINLSPSFNFMVVPFRLGDQN